MDWGYKIIYTTAGIWGHRANTNEYSYSGAKGHWPKTIYRFTRCGDSSISNDAFMDIEIDSDKFSVGSKTATGEIDQIEAPVVKKPKSNKPSSRKGE